MSTVELTTNVAPVPPGKNEPRNVAAAHGYETVTRTASWPGLGIGVGLAAHAWNVPPSL
jgi:hypothetical protein